MSVQVVDGSAVLHVIGDVDDVTLPWLRGQLQHAVLLGAERVVVDLSDAGVFGSAGVHALVEAWRSQQDTGGSIVVEGASATKLAVLRICEVDQLPGLSVRTGEGSAGQRRERA